MDVLLDMSVTLAVFHFETSRFRALSPVNTAKNNVHAVDVDPNTPKVPTRKIKKTKNKRKQKMESEN